MEPNVQTPDLQDFETREGRLDACKHCAFHIVEIAARVTKAQWWSDQRMGP